MGKCYVKPFINYFQNLQPHPKLKWYKVYHSYENAGDILASFELIYYNVIRL